MDKKFDIVETSRGNDFQFNGRTVATLFNDPLMEHPFLSLHNLFDTHTAAVAAHCFLSGLRARVDSPTDDIAIERVLSLLQAIANA